MTTGGRRRPPPPETRRLLLLGHGPPPETRADLLLGHVRADLLLLGRRQASSSSDAAAADRERRRRSFGFGLRDGEMGMREGVGRHVWIKPLRRSALSHSALRISVAHYGLVRYAYRLLTTA